METYKNPVHINDQLTVGNGKMTLFAGPCALESEDLALEVGSTLKALCQKLDIQYVFKASFDKANRTAVGSYRGPGLESGIKSLGAIKDQLKVPIVTDIHEANQAAPVAEIADVLQIPAYLCRQTDLLVAAAKTGKTVKIKRGQFMAPGDMQYAVEKIIASGNQKALLTERGASFGYHNLVVDMRSLPTMRQYAPVIFDVTHSVQQPGGQGGSSGGQREFAAYLARAAAATGVDGFFIESHPDPVNAKSDGPNMIPLKEMPSFLEMLKEAFYLGNKYTKTN